MIDLMVKLESKEDIYAYLLDEKHKTGDVSDLMEKIDDLAFTKLVTLGYIQLGANSNYTPRYKVTTYGRMQCSDYLELCKIKRKLSNYRKKIGI